MVLVFVGLLIVCRWLSLRCGCICLAHDHVTNLPRRRRVLNSYPCSTLDPHGHGDVRSLGVTFCWSNASLGLGKV